MNYWDEIMFQLGPAIPLYIFFVFVIICLIFWPILEFLKSRFPLIREQFTILDKFEDIEEEFGEYFESIDRKKIMWIIDEEKYCREVFGYQTMSDETFQNYKK